MLVLSQQRISFSVDGLVGPEFPRLSGRVGFTLLQFEIARSIRDGDRKPLLVADLWCRILQQAVASLLHACRARGSIVG